VERELELQIEYISKLIASDVPLSQIMEAYSRLGQYVYWQHRLAGELACKHTTVTIEPKDDTITCIDCDARWETLEAYYRVRLDNIKKEVRRE
jgi:hypothetical protein